MKILFILILLTPLLSWGGPENFCDGNPQCSKPMHAIAANYSHAGVPRLTEQLNSFSGPCYHLNPLYSADHAHYGAFVFQRGPAELAVTGLFSFFYSEDPYLGMNAAEVQKRILDAGSHPAPALETPNSVELRYLTDSADSHYWFRGSGNLLWVIGSQASAGASATYVFCEMKRH